MNSTPPQTPHAAAHAGLPAYQGKGKVLAVTSGKGGVGKTFFSANLAAALQVAARLGPGKTVATIIVDSGLRDYSVVVWGNVCHRDGAIIAVVVVDNLDFVIVCIDDDGSIHSCGDVRRDVRVEGRRIFSASLRL